MHLHLPPLRRTPRRRIYDTSATQAGLCSALHRMRWKLNNCQIIQLFLGYLLIDYLQFWQRLGK